MELNTIEGGEMNKILTNPNLGAASQISRNIIIAID
jgi:hypothetical protein